MAKRSFKLKKKNGAPFGNKNSVGHGRPPLPGNSDEDLIKIGYMLLEWMKKCDENDIEVVHLSQFCEYADIDPIDWNNYRVRPCFNSYYARARQWIGRRMLVNKNIPTEYGKRFLGMYFKEIVEHEHEIKDRDAQRLAGLNQQDAANFAKLQEKYNNGLIKQPN